MALGQQGAGLAGLLDDPVDDDLAAVGGDPGGVRAEDHRQLLGAQADAPQRPEVVVVEGGGADVDPHPALRDLGLELTDHQPGQRVVSALRCRVDTTHVLHHRPLPTNDARRTVGRE